MSRRITTSLAFPILGAALLAGCGGSDSGASSAPTAAVFGRVIEVTMTDNRYEPSSFTGTAGEKVTFKFTNNGQSMHEAVIGDEKGQKVHGDDLADGQHSHAGGMHGPAAMDIAPGETRQLDYTLDKAGTLIIGCHIPGHYESGMKATVTVS